MQLQIKITWKPFAGNKEKIDYVIKNVIKHLKSSVNKWYYIPQHEDNNWICCLVNILWEVNSNSLVK